MRIRLCIFVSFLMAAPLSFSTENSTCDRIKSSQDLYECLTKNHPDITSASLHLEVAKSLNDKITQLPNPELSVRSIQGNNAGENVGSTEVGLSFNLSDTLLKRYALKKWGRAEEKISSITVKELEFQAQSQSLKNLYRFRQLLDELETVTEALETFKKIEHQYQYRKVKSPEQSVILNLVELAQGDYELQKNHLITEKTEIDTFLKGILGETFEMKKEWLPSLKRQWPAISLSEISKPTFEFQKISAEKEKSEAEKKLANVESWPNISAGPIMERSTSGTNQFISYGVNVTIDLPVFSLNQAGRTLADKNFLKSQRTYEVSLKKLEFDKKLIHQRYLLAIESLKKSINNKNLKKKHDQIDALFRQGLTSGTSVIEAHRQIVEFQKSQHEHEMEALDALLHLNMLSNKDVVEVL